MSKQYFIFPDIDKLIKTYNIKEVTSSNIFSGKTKRYDVNGLFSEEIFGIDGTLERRIRFGFIDLKNEYIHPTIYDIIKKGNKVLLRGITGEVKYKIVPDTKNKDMYRLEEASDGLSGIALFKECLKVYDKLVDLNQKIKDIISKNLVGSSENKDKSTKRKLLFMKNDDDNNSNEHSDQTETTQEQNDDIKFSKILLRKLLVIPPAYRPLIYVNNNPVIDELNDLYARIIHYTTKSYDDIFGLENHVFNVVQELIWNLYIKLQQSLSKKSGLIRTFMLGKRVDFSARSVIVPDPNLPPDTIAVPYKILARIAEPFIIHILMTGYLSTGEFIPDMLQKKYKVPISKQSLSLILKKYSKDLITDDGLKKLIEAAIDIAIHDKLILSKRDPALHRVSWQATKVVGTHDEAIHVNSQIIVPQGGDFDGDSVGYDTEVVLKVVNKKTGDIKYIKTMIGVLVD